MAGFVVSPQTMQIKIIWTLHGRAQFNVLHALNTVNGPAPPGNANTIHAALNAAWTSTGFGALLATTTSFTGIIITDLRGPNPDPGTVSNLITSTGTNPTVAMPDQVSLVLTERTANAGRSFRGRIYTLGWATDQTDAAGLCLGPSADKAVAWYEALRTSIAGLGWTLAIRSPALPARPSKPGGTLPAKDYTITPVTTILHRDLIWDTNRRRTDILRR